MISIISNFKVFGLSSPRITLPSLAYFADPKSELQAQCAQVSTNLKFIIKLCICVLDFNDLNYLSEMRLPPHK